MEEQTWIGFAGVIIGAILGGLATFLSTHQAYKNNINLEKQKEKLIERSVVLSISEELQSLICSYQEEMDKLYQNLPDNEFLDSSYSITQDFMTIYQNNANKIGLIEDDELRALIIKSYTYFKRYIEYLLKYAQMLKEFNKKRMIFIGNIYPKFINIECSTINTTLDISQIKELAQQHKWENLTSGYLTPVQIKTFIDSDNRAIEELVYFSQDLKVKYFELKTLFNKTIQKILLIYSKK